MASNIPAPILSKMRPKDMQLGEVGKYFETLEFMLEQIQGQTGLNQNQLPESYQYSAFSSALMGALSSGNYELVTTSSNYTTAGNVVVVCGASCTITLNATPNDKEFVIVQTMVSGLVNVVGAINGSSSVNIRAKYDTAKMIYSIDLNRWLIV